VNAHDRIWAALSHEEPDRVPTFAQHIEPLFLEHYDEKYELQDDYGLHQPDLALAKEIGLDSKWNHSGYSVAPRDSRPELPADLQTRFEGKIISDEGQVHARGPNMSWYVDGVLKTPELIREWISYIKTFEVSNETHWNYCGEVWKTGCEIDMVPIPTAGGPTYTSWASVGLDRLAYIVRKYPEVFRDLHAAWSDLAIQQHNCLFEEGIDLVFFCDDHCYKDRCMFSPAQFEDLFVDNFRRMANNAHKHGAKIIMHSDGYLGEEIPLLIKAGIDAAEPLEYEANNRLGPLKEQYGDKISFIGNVAASDVLSYGTVENTIALTKQCILDAAVGGGYILAPGSDVLGTIKIENMKAMIDTTKKFGSYPIDRSLF